MKKIRFAIISDMHCCHSKDPDAKKITRLYSDSLRFPENQHPVQSLINLLRNDSEIRADYLICPGDISDKVSIQGLVSGFSYLQEIKKELNAKELICTPGNHDVDSRNKHKYPSPHDPVKRLHSDYPLRKEELQNKFWSDHFCIYEDEDVILIIFNSTFNHTDETKAEESIIPRTTLDGLEKSLKEYENTDKIKVFICHHHPFPFSNSEDFYKDGDCLQNGDALLKILEEKNVKLVFHGHKHIPRYMLYNSKVHLFAAGSFSSFENIREIDTKNAFHIVDVTFFENEFRGVINTWYFTSARGWNRSRDPHEVLPSRIGFGVADNSISTIANTLNEHLTNKEGNRDIFPNVNVLIPDLNYLTIEQNKQLEELLDEEFRIIVKPSLCADPVDFFKLP